MNTGNLFLTAQAELGGPIALLIAVILIAVILLVYSSIKKKQRNSPDAQSLPKQEEPVIIPESKHEPIHFYKPEEIGVDDAELIAVLTAAIVAATGKSSSTFRVVSFRKKGDWAGNALRELINK